MSPFVREALDRRAEIRAEFEHYFWSMYQRAEDATHGRMLNARGLRAGIDSISLFRGNGAYALAYASEELRDHWREHPRLTFAEYERQRYCEGAWAA